MRALRDQQGHQAVTHQLQCQGALELERCGQQHRGRDGLAEQGLHARIILLMLQQIAPGAIEPDPEAAHGVAFEYEAP